LGNHLCYKTTTYVIRNRKETECLEANGPNIAPHTAHENECLETSGLDIAPLLHSESTNSIDDEFSDGEIDCISANIQSFPSTNRGASPTCGKKVSRRISGCTTQITQLGNHLC